MEYKKTKDKLDLTYNFICAFIKKYNFSPSIRDICKTVGFKSPASVQTYLKKLEEQGKIKRSSNKSRSIEVINNNDNRFNADRIIKIPYLENLEYNKAQKFVFSRCLFKNLDENCFLIPVETNDFNNDGIFYNDIAIIKAVSNADNILNDFVAVINNEKIILIKNSPDISNKYKVIGKYIGLIRRNI